MASIEVSEGEIVAEFSEISSEENDDFFEKLTQKIQRRKLELELENSVMGYGKENHFSNHPPRPSARRKSVSRYDKVREEAKRYQKLLRSIPKQSRRQRYRKIRKSKQKFLETTLRKHENSIRVRGTSDKESSDDELLELRLEALKSKLEVKEIIDEETPKTSPLIFPLSTEEEDLRIQALRTAVMKKSESIKKKIIKKKKLENERPYSPSDDMIHLDVELDDAMIVSPLNSPWIEPEIEQQEVDMEISNSPMHEEKETSDMDTAPSPIDQYTIRGDIDEREGREDNEEAEALRTLLLTSISKKKEETTAMTMNLKMAVQRLKQKKTPATHFTSKSGTKTIAMILAEKKSKVPDKTVNLKEVVKKLKESVPVEPAFDIQPALITEELPEEHLLIEEELSLPDQIEVLRGEPESTSFGLEQKQPAIPTEFPKPASRIVIPPLDPDSSFSTITDTKNIPLLPSSEKSKRSRLITTLVNKPVSRLVITVNADSDTEEEIKNKMNPIKKTTRKIIRLPDSNLKSKVKSPEVQAGFERNLESFLKNIRREQELTGTAAESNLSKSSSVPAKSAASFVKHLPLSSQIEYEQLLEKIKVLENARKMRNKARQLKRTKSNSGSSDMLSKPNSESVVVSSSPSKKLSAPKTVTVKEAIPSKTEETEKKQDKITESLSKIPLLDQEAQQRLINKTEIVYKTHSESLIHATRDNIKLLDENELEMARHGRITAHIADLEKQLKKYKANLNIVNNRVKVNAHKIVQSHREMVKLRMHQRKFGKTCQQVGTMVRGASYSVPELNSSEIEENYKKIAIKTEDIVAHSSDQNVKNSMKIIAERVKGFVADRQLAEEKRKEQETVTQAVVESKETAVSDQTCAKISPNNVQPSETETEVEHKPEHVIEEEEESEVLKMIKENEAKPVAVEPPVELTFPEIQKQLKPVLDGAANSAKRPQSSEEATVVKKLKYESPLEFLRLPLNKNPSVNKILCPYQLEGTCNDEKCSMMHI